ncbi:MAG: threonylcarbamoyl-AMP synthase [Clostridiales bacterium]|nr:threonylcarbamoyl-AMP synthase [Clostridiales bacterium]
MNKETYIIKIDPENMEEQLAYAGKLLSDGKTVAFPTETVYGLGANALSESAVDAIYEAKGRPSDNPLIVHIARLDMLDELAEEIKPYAKILMEAFWPGPITFVVKKKAHVPYKVTGGLETVGVRMPSHPVALKLIDLSGVPVAAPSANLSGKPSPTDVKYVLKDMMGRVDCIVDGGDSHVGLESTVLDVTGDVPVILRPGKITREMIVEIVGACEVDPALDNKSEHDLAPKSPGMKYKHYAPDAQVSVYSGDRMTVIKTFYNRIIEVIESGMSIGVMIFDEDALVLEKLLEKDEIFMRSSDKLHLMREGSSKELDTFARNLFKDLRKLDEVGVDVILVHGVSENALGHAIMNRLEKASEGRVFKI